ncbi:MAG: hypothetical protein IKS66_01535, partial [Oscillospiraceae bacterium]|nr:hypothetical protein [Oscillospiraceae bacterium]
IGCLLFTRAQILRRWKQRKGKSTENNAFSVLFGPSDRVRTCGLVVPKTYGNTFLLGKAASQPFPLRKGYSRVLFFPPIPPAPNAVVVKHVVKKRSRVPGSPSAAPAGAFAP